MTQRIEDTVVYTLDWLKNSPHRHGCSNAFGSSLCSCGKKSIEEDLAFILESGS